MKTTVVNGMKVVYDDTGKGGKGPCILFIHGWAGSHIHWEPAKQFLKSYRLLAPDLFGFGDSEQFGNRTVTTQDYVGLLQSVLSSNGIKDFVVVGHSMGGQIATTLAIQRSDVKGLVLVEAPVGKELHGLQYPILLVFGDACSKMNGATREETARLQQSYNSNAKIAFIDGTSHNPMLENYERFYATLKTFLDSLTWDK